MIDISAALTNWMPQVQGRYINEDWNPENQGFGAQCWDIPANWSRYLGLPKISTGGKGRWPGWAGNMADAFPQSPEIAAAYELLPPSATAQGGDILVWDDSYSVWFPKTHTAVAVRDLGAQLLCISQNSTPSQPGNPYPQWTTGPTTIQHLPRRGLLGIIRPRTGITVQGSITPTTSEEDDDMANLFADRAAFKAAVSEAVYEARFDTRDEHNNITGTITLPDLLEYYSANIAMDRRQLRDGLSASVKSIVTAIKAGQLVDPEAVAAQIADKLDGLTFSVARKEG